MPKRRKLLILASLIVVVAALAILFFYRNTQSPDSARLLPEGDLIFHANLKPVHMMELNNAQSAVETLVAFFGVTSSEYREFALLTGVQLERDMDEVSMSRRDTPDGRDVEASEIFVGRFDQERLKNYLQKLSSGNEQYRNHTIYSISHDGHLVRVALLDAGRVAVTNMASPEPMHGIIDRTFQSPEGPALLTAHYRDVPLGSMAWLIDRIPNRPGEIQLPGGLGVSLPTDTTALISFRYAGSLLFRADIFAQSEAQAKQIVDSANNYLALERTIGKWMGKRGPDPDVKAAFDSIQVEQKENVAVFTATVPQRVFKKIWSETQPESAPAAPARKP